MKNKILLISGLLIATPTLGRQLVAPLNIGNHLSFFNDKKIHDTEHERGIEIWGAGFYRYADKGFSDSHGTTKESLAGLFFGKSEFRLEQAFANSSVTIVDNPWVNISTIKPALEYTEEGAVFGINAIRHSNSGKTRVGLRTKLPIKRVRVEQDSCATDPLEGETIKDVRRLTLEDGISESSPSSASLAPNQTFAYRLDFLSNIFKTAKVTDPMITYPATTASNIAIASQDITTPGSQPVTAVYRSNGTLPAIPFQASTTSGLSNLAADGTGLTNNQRAVFAAATTYADLKASVVNQSKLFITPVAPSGSISSNAVTIREAVEGVVSLLDESALSFLAEKDISLNNQKLTGLGNLDTELFVGRSLRYDTYGELQLGVVLPTDKEIDRSKLLLAQPLGNNNHTEVRIGALLDHEVNDWLGLSANANANFVLKSSELLAGAFSGAVVKNIGPLINANVSWNYYQADLNAHICHPRHDNMGLTLGYNAYIKQKDKVTLPSSMNDLVDASQTTDSSVLALRTDSVAHQAKVHGYCLNDEYNLEGGFGYVFAGKNVPRHLEWHAGMNIAF